MSSTFHSAGQQQPPVSTPRDDEYAFPERKSQPGSAARNSLALREQLVPLLLEQSDEMIDNGSAGKQIKVHVLEIGSGEGEQLATLASDQRLSGVALFQPTEADTRSCLEVNRRCQDVASVQTCRKLDIDFDADWRALRQQQRHDVANTFDVTLVINVIHIVPYATVLRLFAQLAPGAGILRPSTGRLVLYGAFHEDGRATSEGNARFDQYLKDKNPDFGLRDLQRDIVPLAQKHGLRLQRRVDMPSGNLLIVFGCTSVIEA